MTVEISPEAYQALQAQVNEGLYTSIDEAANDGILQSTALTQAAADPAWLEYVESKIVAGLRSAQEEPLIPAEQVIEDLRRRQRAAA